MNYGIILGMVIGDTFYIDDDIKLAFKDSGISHLVAVSGTNITYIIIATKFILDKLLGKKFGNYGSIITIVLFMMIAGGSPSVLRAGIMGIIVIFSSILSKESHLISSMCTTCVLLLLFNPFIICDVGFILSFGGTIGIVLLSPLILSRFKKKIIMSENKVVLFVLETLSVTLSAQIILIPVMWYYFNTISFVSVLTNLLVAPFVSFITIIGIIVYLVSLVFFPFAKVFSYPLYVLVFIVIYISKFCSSIPFGNLTLPTPSIFVIIFYYLCVYFLFFRMKKDNYISMLDVCLRNLDIIVSVLIFSIIAYDIVIPKNYCELNMVGVGQGDAIHIKTSHVKNILIDGGGTEGSDYDVGEKVLVPYLLDNSNGIIDVMVVSHFHEDHAEGLISVLKSLKVKQIVIGLQPSTTTLYEELLKIAKEKNIPIITLYEGQSFSVDGLVFKVIYPGKKIEIENDLNNNSLVILGDFYGRKILFTGDAEQVEESYFIDNLDSKVDILKVGHHGSKTSSNADFLEKMSPNIFLISCGVDNKFGHPHADVINRIKNYSNFIYRTDQNGEISIQIHKSRSAQNLHHLLTNWGRFGTVPKGPKRLKKFD